MGRESSWFISSSIPFVSLFFLCSVWSGTRLSYIAKTLRESVTSRVVGRDGKRCECEKEVAESLLIRCREVERDDLEGPSQSMGRGRRGVLTLIPVRISLGGGHGCDTAGRRSEGSSLGTSTLQRSERTGGRGRWSGIVVVLMRVEV